MALVSKTKTVTKSNTHTNPNRKRECVNAGNVFPDADNGTMNNWRKYSDLNDDMKKLSDDGTKQKNGYEKKEK